MVEEDPKSSSDDPPQPSGPEDAFAEFVASRGEDDATDFEVWVRKFPEFETELRQLEEEWRSFESLFERAVGPRPGSDPLAHRRLTSSPDRVDFVEFTPEREVGDFEVKMRQKIHKERYRGLASEDQVTAA